MSSLEARIADVPSFAYVADGLTPTIETDNLEEHYRVAAVTAEHCSGITGTVHPRDVIAVPLQFAKHMGTVRPSTVSGCVCRPILFETWLPSVRSGQMIAMVRICGSLDHVEEGARMSKALGASINEVMCACADGRTAMQRAVDAHHYLMVVLHGNDGMMSESTVIDVRNACLGTGILTPVDFSISQARSWHHPNMLPYLQDGPSVSNPGCSYILTDGAQQIVDDICRGSFWFESVLGNSNTVRDHLAKAPMGMSVQKDVNWPMEDGDYTKWRIYLIYLLINTPSSYLPAKFSPTLKMI